MEPLLQSHPVKGDVPTDTFRRLMAERRAEALDVALGRWLANRDPKRAEAMAWVGLLLSLTRREGNTGLDLRTLPALLGDLANDEPAEDLAVRIRSAVAASPLVGNPDAGRPLVAFGDLLFLRRFFEGEEIIARAVVARLGGVEAPPPPGRMRPVFDRLFPERERQLPDWQALAAAAALVSRILFVAGGPGTGKTTTVVRMLAALLAEQPDLRIRLAAPTGKAANRLGEAIANNAAHTNASDETLALIPREAMTLHRLLGYRPRSASFSYGTDRPLAADVVVVDEASMIDHALFTALVQALPAEARLVLLGDPDQLASVDAGFVFGDLCRAGEGRAMGERLTRYAEDLGIEGLPEADPNASPIRDAVVTLLHTYRFGPDSGIGNLATALRDGEGDVAAGILGDPAFADVQLLPASAMDRTIRERILPFARKLIDAPTPEGALASIEEMRILTPTRVGPHGVTALNEGVEAFLQERGIRPPGGFYSGQPILVTQNDYDVDLFNGDVGVTWIIDGKRAACFPGGPDGARVVAYHRLPPHEVAWAMTIHKSQGSEFDDVLLVLPDRDHAERLTRELLYTAVTRARKTVTVIGDTEAIRSGTARREQRTTGIEAALRRHRIV
jgi:exodeoxyribonuclease V alpha subunit